MEQVKRMTSREALQAMYYEAFLADYQSAAMELSRKK